MGEFVDAPAHGSTAMPLCACAECIRQGYISAEDAHGMRKAARVVSVGKRGSRGSHTQSAIDQVRERVLEKQCRRRFRVPDDITPQHIEEVRFYRPAQSLTLCVLSGGSPRAPRETFHIVFFVARMPLM
jgi:hypothetical protein